MFDESVWIHLFSDVGGSTTIYPRTLRFSEGSYIYNMERTEFLRVCQARAGRHFQLTPDITSEEFIALFRKITGTTLSMRQFRELEDRFHTFRLEFSAAAELES
jgi:hypothetical protein